MEIQVAHSDRWGRMCVTFRWAGFSGLLPEERFHRLTRAIPEDYRQSRLAGFVWLELAPDEAIDAYLKLPRSEDIADEEPRIYGVLVAAEFFAVLRNRMGSRPKDTCQGGFSNARAVLTDRGVSEREIRLAKLLFIRHGVYCDCQVLQTIEPTLEKLYAGAA